MNNSFGCFTGSEAAVLFQTGKLFLTYSSSSPLPAVKITLVKHFFCAAAACWHLPMVLNYRHKTSNDLKSGGQTNNYAVLRTQACYWKIAKGHFRHHFLETAFKWETGSRMLHRVHEYFSYLNIEICEEDNQRNHIRNLEIQPPLRKCTWPNNATAGLEDCQDKLNLKRGKKPTKEYMNARKKKRYYWPKISLGISKSSQKSALCLTGLSSVLLRV